MFRTGTCLALVVLSSLIAACSPSSDRDPDGEPAARTPEEEPLSDALAVISRDNLEPHLQFLASDERKGRMTGTPEYDESAAYVAQQFETLGLEPGGSDGWYQSVPLIANRIDVESATVTVHEDQGEANLKWKEDFIMGGDEVRDETRVRGEVVFVGYGVHAPDMGYSDYEGIDANGKIVAMFGGAPPAFPHNERAFYSSSRTKADEMVRRGAIGVVALRSRIDQKRVPWDRLSLNAGVRPGMSWVTNTGDYPTVPPDSMIANVNLDMPLLLYPLADVIAFGAEHSSLESVIVAAIKAEDFVLTRDPVPEEVLFIRSDQYSFVRQGVPSVFLFPGFTSTDAEIDGEAIFREHLSTHYHRPSDDRTRPVDWSSALRFARANVRIGLAVADEAARPTWNESDFFGARFGKERLAHTK